MTAFVYDVWNLVMEIQSSNIPPIQSSTNLFVWGKDLSGSMHGAGGVGGLLAASLDGTIALYTYDANGNVGQLVSADGELLAHYEYSPFGETIVSTGPQADANSFRFSTKHWDDLTGLGYWGYRYYNPDMGRWLSRDPIDEIVSTTSATRSRRIPQQFLVFVRNRAIFFIDALGLAASAPPFDNKKACEEAEKVIKPSVAGNMICYKQAECPGTEATRVCW